jgi:hypothetical protein
MLEGEPVSGTTIHRAPGPALPRDARQRDDEDRPLSMPVRQKPLPGRAAEFRNFGVIARALHQLLGSLPLRSQRGGLGAHSSSTR